MIDDIIFDINEFILEMPDGIAGGDILSYSLDGGSYDFISTGTSSELSYIFIS